MPYLTLFVCVSSTINGEFLDIQEFCKKKIEPPVLAAENCFSLAVCCLGWILNRRFCFENIVSVQCSSFLFPQSCSMFNESNWDSIFSEWVLLLSWTFVKCVFGSWVVCSVRPSQTQGMSILYLVSNLKTFKRRLQGSFMKSPSLSSIHKKITKRVIVSMVRLSVLLPVP